MKYEVSDHQVLSSEQVFDGRVVKVFLEDVRLPDGRTVKWESVRHPGAVGMVPLQDDGCVLMVKQYRHAVRGVLLEIPAGKLDPGEDPVDCARRELAEEVGMKAEATVPLAEFFNSPGYSDERFFLYLCTGLSAAPGIPEPDEFLEIVEVPLEDGFAMIADGRIRDAKSIIGLTLARALTRGENGPLGGAGQEKAPQVPDTGGAFA